MPTYKISIYIYVADNNSNLKYRMQCCRFRGIIGGSSWPPDGEFVELQEFLETHRSTANRPARPMKRYRPIGLRQFHSRPHAPNLTPADHGIRSDRDTDGTRESSSAPAVLKSAMTRASVAVMK